MCVFVCAVCVCACVCVCVHVCNIGKVIGEREAEEGYHKQKVKYWHPLLKSGNISYSELYLYFTGCMYVRTWLWRSHTGPPRIPRCTHIDVVLVCT